MLDIPALSRLAGRAPQHLKLRTYFCANPKMSTMHGIELINKVREKDREIPVIVCSGYKGLKGDQELKFHKIAAFIDKPIDVDVLINRIKDLL